jgi:modification methylase
MIIEAAEQAGFIQTDRCVALLAGVQEGRLRARPSFLQLMQLRKARTAGSRLHLIVHEDVLVFAAGMKGRSFRDGEDVQPERNDSACASSGSDLYRRRTPRDRAS